MEMENETLRRVVETLPPDVAIEIAYALAKHSYCAYGAIMLSYVDALVRPEGLNQGSMQARLVQQNYSTAGKS